MHKKIFIVAIFIERRTYFTVSTMTLQQCCHSGLDRESSLRNLDPLFPGNRHSKIVVKLQL